MPGTTKLHFERPDPPEIAALKRVRSEQPELAAAVDMQIELVVLHRRVQARLSTPWATLDLDTIAGQLRRGIPALQFRDVNFDWTELRLLFRQVTDVLDRHDTLEPGAHASLLALVRDGHPSSDEVREWFEYRSARSADNAGWACPYGDGFVQVLDLAARPFVERASESLRSRIDLSEWHEAYCPLCGSDAEMASLSADGGRRLHCGACRSAWPCDPDACLHCGSRDRQAQVAYSIPGGPYRLMACNACRHYVKAFDTSRADRPFMLTVDSIATLSLDAAAMRQGYIS